MTEKRFDLKDMKISVKGGDVEFVITSQDGRAVKYWLSVKSAKSLINEISETIDRKLIEQGRMNS